MSAPVRRLWPARAQALALRLGPSRWHPAVLAWAQQSPSAGRWAVAFSGGPDSLALLLLLWAHWPAQRPRLWAFHFDHRLRGAAARADARFCRRVCLSLGVRFVGGVWRRPVAGASESLARAARFTFLERAAARAKIRGLWFGHQQDDIAESMLMRLARGSGAAGLAAPRPVQTAGPGPVRLRPLLTLKKAELVSALRAASIPWRDDRSNQSDAFFRNRVRRQVAPSWIKASQRDALAGAGASRELLEEDDAALEAWVDRLRSLTPSGRLRLGSLAHAPRAVLRRALHRWLLAQPGAGKLSRQGFDRLLEAVARGKPTRQSFGADAFAVIAGGWLVRQVRRI